MFEEPQPAVWLKNQEEFVGKWLFRNTWEKINKNSEISKVKTTKNTSKYQSFNCNFTFLKWFYLDSVKSVFKLSYWPTAAERDYFVFYSFELNLSQAFGNIGFLLKILYKYSYNLKSAKISIMYIQICLTIKTKILI